MPVHRTNQIRVDSIDDAISFAVASNEQTKELLSKTKATLLKLYSLVFPKLDQKKMLGELTEAFFIDHAEPIEVLKRSSRLFGALLAFQLLMGHGVHANFEELSKVLPIKADGSAVDLGPFTKRARECARGLIELVSRARRRLASLLRVLLGRRRCPRFTVLVVIDLLLSNFL